MAGAAKPRAGQGKAEPAFRRNPRPPKFSGGPDGIIRSGGCLTRMTSRRPSLFIPLAGLLLAFAGGPPATAQPSQDAASEAAFNQANRASMATMMAGMAARPSGNVDRDFVAMMVPHHQGAIDMAIAELKYGRDEQLRRIAQEIIVDQQQEIAAMRLALGEPLPPSTAAPTQAAPPPAHHHPTAEQKDDRQ